MRWTDELRIETPELIDIELEAAGVGSRFVARVIDWLVKWSVVGVAVVSGLIAASLLGKDPFAASVRVLIISLLVVIFYLFFLGFDIYFEIRHNGQTPGKKVAGLRVAREHGGPLDFRAAAIRNILGLADFLPLFYCLGVFLILSTRRSQRLGDLAAGTVVLRERGGNMPEEPAAAIEYFATEIYLFTTEQLRACTGEDRQILRSFFRRYRDMEPWARAQLAVRLCDLLLERLSYQSSRRVIAESFLASLYRELESHEPYTA